MTDTFPKSGRVTEVCKEWLVREDNALAHHLQTQEINDHYKGNRYRNQVVREDFPTALNEQLREKETADRQAALYHQMIKEQAETDAKVARELADKLKHETDLERRRQAQQNEILARQLQDEVLIENRSAPKNELPIPPKNISKKINHSNNLHHLSSPDDISPPLISMTNKHSQLNYISLDLNVLRMNQHPVKVNTQPTQYTQVEPSYGQSSTPGLTNETQYDHINLHSHTPEKKSYNQDDFSDDAHANRLNLKSKNPQRFMNRESLQFQNTEDSFPLNLYDPHSGRHHSEFESSNISHGAHSNKKHVYDFPVNKNKNYSNQSDLDFIGNLMDNSHIDISNKILKTPHEQREFVASPPYLDKSSKIIKKHDAPNMHSNLMENTRMDKAHSIITNPYEHREFNAGNSPSKCDWSLKMKNERFDDYHMHSNALDGTQYGPVTSKIESKNKKINEQFKTPHANAQYEKLSTEKFDYLMGNNLEHSNQDEYDSPGAHSIREPQIVHEIRQLQEEVLPNKIRNAEYGNNERIKTLQELGVPADEIFEIDRRITQEERDEELARLLQQQEDKNLTFEEQDRLVAMEAQDKELARMLQERERAKAKRAKERARIRKQQQRLQQDDVEHQQRISPNHSRSQSDPLDMDGDSYSDPIDLIPMHENKKMTQSLQATNQMPLEYYNQEHRNTRLGDSTKHYTDSMNLNEENYSNPIDLIKPQYNASVSVNIKKQSGNFRKDEDIYQLPVSENASYMGPTRPNNLDIRGPLNRPAAARSHASDTIENIATVIDPTYEHTSLKSSPLSTPGVGLPALPDFLDQSSSPVPPYMPIQGTRRNASLENKKKKTKDKCTHQ